jgi:hypothetical protein
MEDVFGEVICSCSSGQAAEDDILFDITQVNPEWEKGIFRYVTIDLMEHGYLQDDKVIIPDLLNLLYQSLNIVWENSNEFKDRLDPFYAGDIELPDGKKQQIFLELNGIGKYTIRLPEGH